MNSRQMQMFSVPIYNIRPGIVLPFSVFLYFSKNSHFVRYRFENDFIDDAKLQALMEKGIEEVWLLESDRQKYIDYLSDLVGEGNPPPKKTIRARHKVVDEHYVEKTSHAEEVYVETELVRATFAEDTLSDEEKKQILSAVSKDLLDSFSKINSAEDRDKREGLSKCRQIADEILVIASQNSNIYDEIIFIRQSQEDLEHSIVVSTLTAMFALALGYFKPEDISEMVVAALFHDLGVSKVHPATFGKLPQQRSARERMECEDHVKHSIELLGATSGDFSPKVYRIISEHHENHDGSGFPEGKAGLEILPESEVVHMANWFDRLSTGKVTGERIAPKKCFRVIYDAATNADAVKEVTPKMISTIFDFMLDKKQQSKTEKQAGAIAESVQEKNLKKTG